MLRLFQLNPYSNIGIDGQFPCHNSHEQFLLKHRGSYSLASIALKLVGEKKKKKKARMKIPRE